MGLGVEVSLAGVAVVVGVSLASVTVAVGAILFYLRHRRRRRLYTSRSEQLYDEAHTTAQSTPQPTLTRACLGPSEMSAGDFAIEMATDQTQPTIASASRI